MTTTQNPASTNLDRPDTPLAGATLTSAAPGLTRRQLTEYQNSILPYHRPDSAANIFDQATLMELNSHIDYVALSSHLKGLVLTSAKKSIFIAGADLTQLSKARSPEELQAMIEL